MQRVQAIPATTQGARLLLAGMEGHCLHDSFVLKTVEKSLCPALYVLRASEVSSLVEGGPWDLQATNRTGGSHENGNIMDNLISIRPNAKYKIVFYFILLFKDRVSRIPG